MPDQLTGLARDWVSKQGAYRLMARTGFAPCTFGAQRCPPGSAARARLERVKAARHGTAAPRARMVAAPWSLGPVIGRTFAGASMTRIGCPGISCRSAASTFLGMMAACIPQAKTKRTMERFGIRCGDAHVGSGPWTCAVASGPVPGRPPGVLEVGKRLFPPLSRLVLRRCGAVMKLRLDPEGARCR